MSSLLSRICLLSKRALQAVRPNRELLTFSFFLVLSGIFWLSTSLNEYYDREILIPVNIEGLPKNVVVSSLGGDTIHVTVRDKGFAVLNYLYGSRAHSIVVDFTKYSKTNGKAIVTNAELQKLVKQQLYASSALLSMKPDRLEYDYVKGLPKNVPVRLAGDVVPAENYYLAHSQITPQTVTIFAGRHLLDSIKYVVTKDVSVTNFTDTVDFEVELKAIPGVRISPQKVTVKLFPDVLTEETVEVPVTAVNVPEGIQLRMFPARVKVKFNVGVSQYRSVNVSQFRIEADYNSITSESEHCPIKITKTPIGVSKATLEVQHVDYLIEN